MSYIDRVIGSLVFGVVVTATLVVVGIATSWAFGLAWGLPFLLTIEGHQAYVLFEPHLVGLTAVAAVLATLSAAAWKPAQRRGI